MTKLIPDIAVLASGTGSNFRAIAQSIKDGRLAANVSCFLTDNPDAKAIEIAKEFAIPCFVEPFSTKQDHESRMLSVLRKRKPKWLVLAGYMRLLTKNFLENFYDAEKTCYRVVNIHPSLLPAFPGKDAYRQAFEYGVQWTGVTVHLVSTGCDDGAVIAQSPLEIRPNDTLASLTARGLSLEHQLYSQALQKLFRETWGLESAGDRRRVVWK